MEKLFGSKITPPYTRSNLLGKVMENIEQQGRQSVPSLLYAMHGRIYVYAWKLWYAINKTNGDTLEWTWLYVCHGQVSTLTFICGHQQW